MTGSFAPGRRSAADGTRRGLLLSVVGGAVAGCGFRPVYMAGADKKGASAGLAEIEVKPIYDRPGQILRQTLMARLASDGGTPHRYDLQVNFWITGEEIGVLPTTQSTRIRLAGHANWVLLNRDARPLRLVEGSERVIDGFDQFDSQFFTFDMDNERVQRRVAAKIADNIALRLAIWFGQRAAAAG